MNNATLRDVLLNHLANITSLPAARRIVEEGGYDLDRLVRANPLPKPDDKPFDGEPCWWDALDDTTLCEALASVGLKHPELVVPERWSRLVRPLITYALVELHAAMTKGEAA